MNKLIKLSILAAAIAISSSAVAMTTKQANEACDQIGVLSERYALYGAVELKSMVAIIKNDATLPEYLKKIITDSYIYGMGIGVKITSKQRESIKSSAKDKCLVYLTR
jgi:hypothetical protein